jgi:pyrroloquinoline-quinone synthase
MYHIHLLWKGEEMTIENFLNELDSRIRKYDLLCHPFYKAWSAGELTREDLREYACDYYHHVQAFPSYLAELGVRLDEGELRNAILANMCDEKGGEDAFGVPERPHAELWLDFAEGMGASRALRGHQPIAEVKALMEYFSRIARERSPEEALAAFYAYESQVPRIAQEKARGLQEIYGADEKTYGYFTLHATADVYHARVWREQLAQLIEQNPWRAEAALASAEDAAKALWTALDGIERRRRASAAA